MNDELMNKRKKLIFRSEHRGTKEMDLLMGSFAKKHVPDFSAEELRVYEDLLQENDPNLYNWIIGKDNPPANIDNAMFQKLQAHKLV